MMDLRREAMMLRSKEDGVWGDRTADVQSWSAHEGRVHVVFVSSEKSYSYLPKNVLILRDPQPIAVDEECWVEVRNAHRPRVTSGCVFASPEGNWVRIFWQDRDGEKHGLYPEREVRFLENAASGEAKEVLGYWSAIVDAKASKAKRAADGEEMESQRDFLQSEFHRLGDIHPESVLNRFCAQIPVVDRDDIDVVPLAPFHSNLSQRKAVQNALSYPISVIEGPPGTGKTQTILNLLATVVAGSGLSVGVVSSNNAAVDNVRDKLQELGFGFVAASLGNKDKRTAFFDEEAQTARNTDLAKALAEPGGQDGIDPSALVALAQRLDALQQEERVLASRRQELEAYLLEQEHFLRFLDGQEMKDIAGKPLLEKSSDRLMDYLADAALDKLTDRPFAWVRRLRNRLKYGSLRGMDPHDTDVLLRVQQAYYAQKISELRDSVAELEQRLEHDDLEGLLAEYSGLSLSALQQGLQGRYADVPASTYEARDYHENLPSFFRDYPVLLSTTHSLRASLGYGTWLLDLLIIDEASQVDLLTAALALASCRRVVIVGDRRQLPHIAEDLTGTEAEHAEPPAAAFDYHSQSVLSAFQTLYGDELPTTLLREHYRCHPAVIGFCNEKFYGGELITLTAPGKSPGGFPPMIHVRTEEGNHMRRMGDRGWNNQREADVIAEELRTKFCPDVKSEDLGVVSPYRKQVETVGTSLRAQVDAVGTEVDTVHRFQGREKRAVIMTTVLDDSWRGRWDKMVAFVDDPQLINVAVSRAKERFILVTSHGMLPTSRNLRDLMGYIRYLDPDQEVTTSSIVSVFDLLYKNYSKRLDGLASRLRGEQRYPSEDIIWTVLGETLEEDAYRGLEVVPQVLLRNLVPDTLELTERERLFVKHRSSVDFVIYNRITREPLVTIEVDGVAYHPNSPQQLERDGIKDGILDAIGLKPLRLQTNKSGELAKITAALDAALIS